MSRVYFQSTRIMLTSPSRVSVGSFRRLNPNYEMPVVKSEMPVFSNGPDPYGNYPPTPPPIPYNPSKQ